MNTKTIEENWTELRTQIKAKWDKLTEDELDTLKGDLSQLAGKVQKAYGTAKDIADREFEDFKKSVHSLITPAPKASWVITAENDPARAKKTKQI